MSEGIRLQLFIHLKKKRKGGRERGRQESPKVRSRFWCRMSHSPTFPPSSSKSQTSTPQVGLNTCETRGTSCQDMAESQDSCTFGSRTSAVNRRHSVDGTISLASGSIPGRALAESDRFHPYRRQFSDGAVADKGCLQQCSPAFTPCGDGPPSWDQYNGSIQVSRLTGSYSDLPAAPVEPSCFLPQSLSSYSSLNPQVSSRLYPHNESNGSKYSLQGPSTQSQQENTSQSLFPKPIYSYSILIFMALKNSKTGSLPVSEIYSFMTEHFPYFKTAPDGWKNSVRHNLSLNKCFEKVENKNGNSSRKGCLWALNPAKVEKMQEELHKWRRKDPVTMRRSMARPEDLDRLFGERPGKLRYLPSYTSPALLSRRGPIYSSNPSSCSSAQLRPPYSSSQRSQYTHLQPPCYLPPPPAAAHPSNSFSLYSPRGHQPAATGGLNSPSAGKMPPVYHPALQAEYSIGQRSMQDLLLEGDAAAAYDIDTLNPSLIDLQLQGNLWEELRDDSFNQMSEQHVTTLTSASALQDHHTQSSGLPGPPPVTQPSAVINAGRCKAEYEDEEMNVGQNPGPHGCLSGLHPVVYSGVESLAGYLTSCTTSISLM